MVVPGEYRLLLALHFQIQDPPAELKFVRKSCSLKAKVRGRIADPPASAPTVASPADQRQDSISAIKGRGEGEWPLTSDSFCFSSLI